MFLLVPIVLQAQTLVARDVDLRYTRPSHIVELVLPRSGKRGLLPLGVAVEPDDAHGVIHLRGKASKVAEAEKLIDGFDVEAREGKFVVSVESPSTHERCEAVVTLRSSQKWSMSDGLTGTQVTLLPNVFDDGRALITLNVKFRGESQTMKFALKPGDRYDANHSDGGVRSKPPVTVPTTSPIVQIRYVKVTDDRR